MTSFNDKPNVKLNQHGTIDKHVNENDITDKPMTRDNSSSTAKQSQTDIVSPAAVVNGDVGTKMTSISIAQHCKIDGNLKSSNASRKTRMMSRNQN